MKVYCRLQKMQSVPRPLSRIIAVDQNIQHFKRTSDAQGIFAVTSNSNNRNKNMAFHLQSTSRKIFSFIMGIRSIIDDV